MIIEVPGKVFIMGEYSVIDGQSPAIIAKTQRTLTLKVTPSHSYIFESSLEPYFEEKTWDDFLCNHPSKIFKEIVKTFQDEGYTLKISPSHFHIQSRLDDEKHAYGLGSSGAFRVAIIRALLQLMGHEALNDNVFDLAVKSHQKDMASYADLAVSTYNMNMIYHKATQGKRPKIIPTSVPEHVIIHSGKKISSTPFIASYMEQKESSLIIQYSQKMKALIKRFEQSNPAEKIELIKEAQAEYQTMAETLHKDILTEPLRKIVKIIHQQGGIAKISGAGGGDNVLAFFKNKASHESFKSWIQKDYILL